MTIDDGAMPQVSIVIPVYNAEAFVHEAIASVRRQTYPHIELIVVDDGSTDGTPAVLAAESGALRHFWQENAGQSAALNLGWTQSGGALLGYLSADDRLHPEAVAELVAALHAQPAAVLAYPDFEVIDARSEHLRTVTAPDYDETLLVADFHCLPGPGALFRRSAWAQAGGWDTGLRQIPDMDFFLRLGQVGPFVHVARPLADFRMHAESTTYRACSAMRADEPLHVIGRLYASDTLPPRWVRHRRRATASALLLSGFMHGFSGRYGICARRMARAFRIHPPTVLSRRMLSHVIAIVRRPRGAA